MKLKCDVCNRSKAEHLYYAQKGRRKDGQTCKSCTKKSPSYRKTRSDYLERVYGITLQEYETMLQQQGGVCAVCWKYPRSRALAVDHDHAVGEGRESVRGLLCRTCNEYLGHIGDDPRAAERMRRYLQRPLIGKQIYGTGDVEIMDDALVMANQITEPNRESIDNWYALISDGGRRCGRTNWLDTERELRRLLP
jgi:hypothetical protein